MTDDDIERRWQEWLELCASPPRSSSEHMRIIVDVDLADPNIATTLTVQPRAPLMSVALTLRLVVEAIESGQIDSLRWGNPT